MHALNRSWHMHAFLLQYNIGYNAVVNNKGDDTAYEEVAFNDDTTYDTMSHAPYDDPGVYSGTDDDADNAYGQDDAGNDIYSAVDDDAYGQDDAGNDIYSGADDDAYGQDDAGNDIYSFVDNDLDDAGNSIYTDDYGGDDAPESGLDDGGVLGGGYDDYSDADADSAGDRTSNDIYAVGGEDDDSTDTSYASSSTAAPLGGPPVGGRARHDPPAKSQWQFGPEKFG